MATLPRNLRAGLFLLVAVAALIALVAVLGKQQSIFSQKVKLNTSFLNISGLVVGAPVRLAGVDVGLVQDIAFDKDLKSKSVHVVLGVEGRYMERIREDSVASLGSKGLLGDMIVNVTVGDPGLPQVKPGATLPSKEQVGLTELVATVQDALGNIKNLSGDLGTAVKGLLTKEVSNDFGKIIHSASNIMAQAEHGPGLVHSLVYEKKMAQDTGELISSARVTAGDADHAIKRVDAILQQTDLRKAILNIQSAAANIDSVISEVKTGNGMAHTLIFERDTSHLVENVTQLSTALRTVGEDLEKGRGTIGALLKDPTIYADLKIILGNVKRSRLLRSLVRFAISSDDLEAAPPPK